MRTPTRRESGRGTARGGIWLPGAAVCAMVLLGACGTAAGAPETSAAPGGAPQSAASTPAPNPRSFRLVVSGDRFVSTTAESRALQAELPDALAVEMEGAALAQVCAVYGVPFVAVRTISDRADDAAHVDFSRFVSQVASRYSLAILSAWLGASK